MTTSHDPPSAPSISVQIRPRWSEARRNPIASPLARPCLRRMAFRRRNPVKLAPDPTSWPSSAPPPFQIRLSKAQIRPRWTEARWNPMASPLVRPCLRRIGRPTAESGEARPGSDSRPSFEPRSGFPIRRSDHDGVKLDGIRWSEVGGLLRQSVARQVESHLSPSTPSIFQAVRWMSSSKVFIGGLSYR